MRKPERVGERERRERKRKAKGSRIKELRNKEKGETDIC